MSIKLAVLVWKKILENRRKIESVLISFIDEILKSYNIIPTEVKFIMREYYKMAKNKFGEVKYEDIKTFFNKVIYSQLLLPEFMRMLEEENGVSSNVKNFNIPIIALFSQKILYGQEFYDKQKYTYFNQLITHYLYNTQAISQYSPAQLILAMLAGERNRKRMKNRTF